MMERPPCWPEGQPCPNNCASQLYERVVYNHTPLFGPWAGYRFTGKDLVAPDGQRINERRLQGILWRDQMELRRAGFASRRQANRGAGTKVKVLVIDLQEYRGKRSRSCWRDW